MVKKERRIFRKRISNNMIAILLIIAIVISCIGTYYILYEASAPKTIRDTANTVGMVGVYVENLNISEEGEVNEGG